MVSNLKTDDIQPKTSQITFQKKYLFNPMIGLSAASTRYDPQGVGGLLVVSYILSIPITKHLFANAESDN